MARGKSKGSSGGTNKVFLNKHGVIEEIFIGRQNFESVMETAVEMMKLSDTLRRKNKKVSILANVRGITSVSADALLAAIDVINSSSISKIVVYGGNSTINRFAELVIIATGRKRSIKIFDNKGRALKWLKPDR